MPQILVFALSFALVASIWWFHHKVVRQPAVFDVGLISLSFVLLGLVALIPFPAKLLSKAPTARPAVIPFIAVFPALAIVFLLMVLRAHRADAWRQPHHRPRGSNPFTVNGGGA